MSVQKWSLDFRKRLVGRSATRARNKNWGRLKWTKKQTKKMIKRKTNKQQILQDYIKPKKKKIIKLFNEN